MFTRYRLKWKAKSEELPIAKEDITKLRLELSQKYVEVSELRVQVHKLSAQLRLEQIHSAAAIRQITFDQRDTREKLHIWSVAAPNSLY